MVLTPFQLERLCISRLRSKEKSFDQVSSFLRELESYMMDSNRMKCMTSVGLSYADVSKIFNLSGYVTYARIKEDWYPRKVRFLLGNFKSEPYISNSDLWSSDFPYLLGAYMHQNHKSRGFKKTLKNKSVERINKFAKSVEEITGILPEVVKYGDSFEVYIPQSLGKRVDDMTRARRLVPWEIYSVSNYRKRFLEGFYSLRRRTGKSNPKSIEFATSDLLAKQVALLLVREGIYPRITQNHRDCTEIVVSHADEVEKLLEKQILVEPEDIKIAQKIISNKRNPGHSSKIYFRAKTLSKMGVIREEVANRLGTGSSTIHYWLDKSPPRTVKRLKKILDTKKELEKVLIESKRINLVEFLDLIGVDSNKLPENVLYDLEGIVNNLRDSDDFGLTVLEDFEFRTNERFRETKNPDYLVLGSMAVLKESLFDELKLSSESHKTFEGNREEILEAALKEGYVSSKELGALDELHSKI